MCTWARRAWGSLGIPQISIQCPGFPCVLSRHFLQHGSLPTWGLCDPRWSWTRQEPQGLSRPSLRDRAVSLSRILLAWAISRSPRWKEKEGPDTPPLGRLIIQKLATMFWKQQREQTGSVCCSLHSLLHCIQSALLICYLTVPEGIWVRDDCFSLGHLNLDELLTKTRI